MFNKDIEKVYEKIESYLRSEKYDRARVYILSEMLLSLEQDIIPKWQLENLGYFEVNDLKLYDKQQWVDTLSTDKGVGYVISRLKEQDESLERYHRVAVGTFLI
jgi:hypothetical protein